MRRFDAARFEELQTLAEKQGFMLSEWEREEGVYVLYIRNTRRRVCRRVGRARTAGLSADYVEKALGLNVVQLKPLPVP